MPDRHQVMTPTTPLGGIRVMTARCHRYPLSSRASGSTSPTFHALYEAMPPGTRAELINGVVYMPGPVGRPHSREHMTASAGSMTMLANTPGVEGLDNASTAWASRASPSPT